MGMTNVRLSVGSRRQIGIHLGSGFVENGVEELPFSGAEMLGECRGTDSELLGNLARVTRSRPVEIAPEVCRLERFSLFLCEISEH